MTTPPAKETGSSRAPALTHEDTYRRGHPAWRIHRARLDAIENVMREHALREGGSWADFGCSNGFVIEEIVRRGAVGFERIAGFDHSPELLEGARAKGIARATFEPYDLNEGDPSPRETFDVVTCFEVLEHVGDYRRALAHLAAHVSPGGLLILTVPNEAGLPGLVKLVGRKVLRPDPYEDFFQHASVWRYVGSLVTGRSIDGFRVPGRSGYGPHLGFDYRALKRHIDVRYLQPGDFEALAERRTLLGMNVVLVYRRSPAQRRTT